MHAYWLNAATHQVRDEGYHGQCFQTDNAPGVHIRRARQGNEIALDDELVGCPCNPREIVINFKESARGLDHAYDQMCLVKQVCESIVLVTQSTLIS